MFLQNQECFKSTKIEKYKNTKRSLKINGLHDDLQILTLFPAIQHKCRLLSHLLIYLAAYIANNMNPDQTAPKEQSDLGCYCLFP